MTEQEWLACQDLSPMISFLRGKSVPKDVQQRGTSPRLPEVPNQ
jgi:hypothetical protein